MVNHRNVRETRIASCHLLTRVPPWQAMVLGNGLLTAEACAWQGQAEVVGSVLHLVLKSSSLLIESLCS